MKTREQIFNYPWFKPIFFCPLSRDCSLETCFTVVKSKLWGLFRFFLFYFGVCLLQNGVEFYFSTKLGVRFSRLNLLSWGSERGKPWRRIIQLFRGDRILRNSVTWTESFCVDYWKLLWEPKLWVDWKKILGINSSWFELYFAIFDMSIGHSL